MIANKLIVVVLISALAVAHLTHAATLEQVKKNPLEGYVLTNPVGNVIGDSGVRLGPLDLKFETVATLQNYGMPQALIQRLQPYLGVSGTAAINRIREQPLKVSQEEFNVIEQKVVAFWTQRASSIPPAIKSTPAASRLLLLAKNKQWAEVLEAAAAARETIRNIQF